MSLDLSGVEERSTFTNHIEQFHIEIFSFLAGQSSSFFSYMAFLRFCFFFFLVFSFWSTAFGVVVSKNSGILCFYNFTFNICSFSYFLLSRWNLSSSFNTVLGSSSFSSFPLSSPFFGVHMDPKSVFLFFISFSHHILVLVLVYNLTRRPKHISSLPHHGPSILQTYYLIFLFIFLLGLSVFFFCKWSLVLGWGLHRLEGLRWALVYMLIWWVWGVGGGMYFLVEKERREGM